jgi:hypothetical protein
VSIPPQCCCCASGDVHTLDSPSTLLLPDFSMGVPSK